MRQLAIKIVSEIYANIGEAHISEEPEHICGSDILYTFTGETENCDYDITLYSDNSVHSCSVVPLVDYEYRQFDKEVLKQISQYDFIS